MIPRYSWPTLPHFWLLSLLKFLPAPTTRIEVFAWIFAYANDWCMCGDTKKNNVIASFLDYAVLCTHSYNCKHLNFAHVVLIIYQRGTKKNSQPLARRCFIHDNSCRSNGLQYDVNSPLGPAHTADKHLSIFNADNSQSQLMKSSHIHWSYRVCLSLKKTINYSIPSSRAQIITLREPLSYHFEIEAAYVRFESQQTSYKI